MRGLRRVQEVGRSFGSGFERALLRVVAVQLERGYFSSSPHKSHRVWLDWLPGGKMICISLYLVVGKLRGDKIRLFAVDICSDNEGFSHLFVQEATLSGFLFNWWHKIHTPPFGRMIQQDFSSELSLVWLSKCQDEAGVPLGSGRQHQLPVFQTALEVLLLPYIRSSQAICFIFLILFGDTWKISVPGVLKVEPGLPSLQGCSGCALAMLTGPHFSMTSLLRPQFASIHSPNPP